MEEKKQIKIKVSTCIIFSIVFLIVFVLSIIGICLYANRDVKEIKFDTAEIGIENPKKEKMYIGINDCFLGIYEDGKWYNSQKYASNYTINGDININYKEITIDEVVNQEKYYKHMYGKNAEEMKNYLYDRNIYPEYYKDIEYFRFKNTDENETEKSYVISTMDTNIFNTEYREIKQTKSYNKYVEEVLKEYSIEKCTTNIDFVIEADFEKDGKNEYIIAASSPLNDTKNETLEGEESVYSFVILVKENKTKVLMSEVEVASELSINIPTIVKAINLCDLNNDLNPEICIETLYWDHPEKYVFSYDKGSVDLVLYGDFTW